MADATSSLEKQALERKEKLKALKARKTEKKEDAEKEAEEPKKTLKFRSYMPTDESLKEKRLPKAKPTSVEELVSEQVETAKNPDLGDVNLANLAPRKIDWDLKRDISKKLEKLERRTQKAIVEILREKYKNDDDNLAEAVDSVGGGLVDDSSQTDSN